MAGPRSYLRNRVEDAAVGLFLGILGRVGAERADGLGRAVGRVARFALPGRRRLTEENISRAYPEKMPAEVKALAREVWSHFGGMLASLLRDARRPVSDLLTRVEFAGGEHLREAVSRGRGIFILTGHMGNWEIAALTMGAHGFPFLVVARPLDNPLLDARLRAFREATGNRVVAKNEAVRVMLRTLREKGMIGILPDQHVDPPDAVVVPFFGRPAATTTAVARLAARTGALIVPTFCHRTGPDRWKVDFLPALDVSTLPEEERTVEAVTARVSGILEEVIRRHPGQWLWLHNRWRVDGS